MRVRRLFISNYRPRTKFREGNVFTSVYTQGVGISGPIFFAGVGISGTRPLLGMGNPPPRTGDHGIWSASGQDASYWNAFLSSIFAVFTWLYCKWKSPLHVDLKWSCLHANRTTSKIQHGGGGRQVLSPRNGAGGTISWQCGGGCHHSAMSFGWEGGRLLSFIQRRRGGDQYVQQLTIHGSTLARL